MNAKQKPKIELFFSGLNEKYRQNKDYFQQLSWTVRSGRKEYRGNAVEENGRFYTGLPEIRIMIPFRLCCRPCWK